MKTSFLLLALLTSFVASSQGVLRDIDGPIIILDTLHVNAGDTVLLGQGSSPTHNFLYVYTSSMNAAPNTFASRRFVIKELKFTDNKNYGKKYYAILNIPGLFKYRTDLESAIRFGEIIGINSIRFDKNNASPSTTIIQNKPSVADELAKLKKLYDDGVLTKEEYEAQKKKLLDGN